MRKRKLPSFYNPSSLFYNRYARFTIKRDPTIRHIVVEGFYKTPTFAVSNTNSHTMFTVGQKVVCVDPPAPRVYDYWIKLPVVGGVYTIRGFHPAGDAVYLVEIVNPPVVYIHRNGPRELAFYSHRFRPLDDLHEQLDRIEREGCPEEEPELLEAIA